MPAEYVSVTRAGASRVTICFVFPGLLWLCVRVAAASESQAVTAHRTGWPSPAFTQQPPPALAYVTRFRVGSATTPTTGRSPTVRPIITLNSPFLMANPLVPSIGSTTHRRAAFSGAAAAVGVTSSATSPSAGKAACRCCRMISCAPRSAWVEMCAGASGMAVKVAYSVTKYRPAAAAAARACCSSWV